MPWKETSVMDERMKFIGRLLNGEKMAYLCREFGISRVPGHKIWSRYEQDGSRGLYNRSRAHHKHPNQLPFEVEQLIVRLKRDKPHWGAPKIRELVSHQYPSISLPAVSTVHCVLDRHGLVNKQRRRKKFPVKASYLSVPKESNDLWCTDFKGQFRMRNQAYCSFLISNCGRVCFGKQKVHISKAFANQPIGIKKVDYGIWQVDFMSYTLGYFDEESDKFAPNDDPFGFKLDHCI